MSSAEVIDALFVRTVDIVQSLPKTGPIQTSYEEKLALYSLYKQATEGDVQSRRPGMLDMLGRAKYDAWSNRRGLSRQDAKQLYVESMLKTLRKFSDRPQAIALIEELESFSGDVAQRVMSASLARAGDSDSDLSSEADEAEQRLSPAVQRASLEPSLEDEDERDAVSQLPRTQLYRGPALGGGGMPSTSLAAGLRSGQRTPMSVEGASAMAVRGQPHARTATSSVGGGSVTEEDELEANRRLSGAELAARRIYGTSASVGGRAPLQGRGNSWQRASGGQLPPQSEGRLYAVPGQRYPGPPASDAPGGVMGGGAGASLYSAVGPSARPTPSEQHFYHHHGQGGNTEAGQSRGYAPASSIGGRSGGGGGQGRNQAGRGGDVDLALQSIQASLSALHERLNRVEGKGAGRSGGAARNSAFGPAYRAFSDALHDIAVLLGLRSDGRGGVAPSTYRGDGAESVASRGGRRPAARPNAWRTVMRLLIALAQVALRIALDATSIVVVLSVLLLVVKRLTGRGDPLLVLKLLRRWLGVRVPARAIQLTGQSTDPKPAK